MKILIADDSSHKIEELRVFFEEEQITSDSIDVATSFKDTIRKIIKEKFDLVILDMSMPSSEGSLGTTSRSLAGKDVLSTVYYKRISGVNFILFSQFSEFGRHDEVVSFEEIYSSLKNQYEDILLGSVSYQESSNEWKNNLLKIIKKTYD
ncbi:response regulator [Idiomarina abyssalis]|uniref:response regulator n=1 Tax=Idiomarina abyssalis TaxID=86102 RepID=UPI003A8CCCC3